MPTGDFGADPTNRGFCRRQAHRQQDRHTPVDPLRPVAIYYRYAASPSWRDQVDNHGCFLVADPANLRGRPSGTFRYPHFRGSSHSRSVYDASRTPGRHAANCYPLLNATRAGWIDHPELGSPLRHGITGMGGTGPSGGTATTTCDTAPRYKTTNLCSSRNDL